jgi:hypothetical protein
MQFSIDGFMPFTHKCSGMTNGTDSAAPANYPNR